MYRLTVLSSYLPVSAGTPGESAVNAPPPFQLFQTSDQVSAKDQSEGSPLPSFVSQQTVHRLSGVPVPRAVEEIRTAPVLHDRVVDAVDMPAAVKDILKIK